VSEATVTILEHPQAQALLADAVLDERQLRRLADGLEPFLQRYLPLFQRAEQRVNARLVLEGKLSALSRKTCEPIAHAAGTRREVLQDFVGSSPWDDDALLAELRRHVAEEWADPEAVLAIDGSTFPKKGKHSCGVARQWCGRLGKVENCQSGVFLAYACRRGHVGIDRRLWLPEEWAGDGDRRAKARVPEGEAYEEHWRTALKVLDRCRGLPHGWVAADSEFGRVTAFRAALRGRGERYAVDVREETSVRDLGEPVGQPVRRHGSKKKAPFRRADEWAALQPAGRWARVEVRAGEKGPLAYDVLEARVPTMEGKRVGPVERLVVLRWEEGGGQRRRYVVSNAAGGAALAEVVRAAAERHRVEQVFEEGKGEVGLGQYEVRSWVGWHHHMALSLLALWFLALSRDRDGGENPGADGGRGARGAEPRAGAARPDGGGGAARVERDAPTQRGGADLLLDRAHRPLPAQTNRWAARKVG
jgi:SRSO17 transposase